MLKKLVSIAVLAVFTTLSLAACGGGDDPGSPTAVATVAPPPPAQAPPAAAASDVVKVVNQDPGGTGKYKFAPSEFKFKLGETVNFEMKAETEFHTFNVDALGIDQSADGGETITFTYTFDKAGTFELYCIPHKSLGMVAEIIVE
jgi:plastocyanin